VRKHRRSPNNGSTREKLPKHALPVPRSFCETVAAKTCLIIALYFIFSRKVILQHPPPLMRVFSRFLRKRVRRQIEGGIRISLEKAILKPEKTKHLQLSKPGKKHGSKIIKADGYVDNSPLRSKLTTYPQPLLPGQREEVKGRRAKTANAIPTWVIHNQPPPDLCFADPPGGCVWITP